MIEDLPKPFETVIAMIDAGPMGKIPMTGYIVEIPNKRFFYTYAKTAYELDLITKWAYLSDVFPQFMPRP